MATVIRLFKEMPEMMQFGFLAFAAVIAGGLVFTCIRWYMDNHMDWRA